MSRQKNQQLQGVVIIDVHSINKKNAINILLQPDSLIQQIQSNYWQSQENFEEILAVEYKLDKQQLSDLREESGFYNENVKEFKVFNLDIPQNYGQNPFIIPFDLEMVWHNEVKTKHGFVSSSKPSERCSVRDVHAEQGEIVMATSFWNLDPQREKDFQLISANIQKENKHDIEISEHYFKTCYQEIIFIGGGSFGKVDLYFDRKQKKLLAVKQLLDLFKDPIDIQEHDVEYERVMYAIKNSPRKANDQQIEGLQRNIVREIKVLQQLNLEKDERRKYINSLEGVILPYIDVSQNNRYKTILLVFEFFGSWEMQNQTLTSDIYRYFSNLNNWQRFNNGHESVESKRKFIKQLFYKIYSAVGYLHEKEVMIRDLKDDNILIRREYDQEKLGSSQYEIMIIDFGLAKRSSGQGSNKENKSTSSGNTNKLHNSSSGYQDCFESMELNKQTSIVYQADMVPSRHPIYRYTEPFSIEYNKKDDVYAMGVLLLRLHNYFQMLNHIDRSSQKFVEMMTGLSYDMARDYLIDMLSKRTEDASECLKEELDFNEKNLAKLKESRNSIKQIQEIPPQFIKDWLEQEDLFQSLSQSGNDLSITSSDNDSCDFKGEGTQLITIMGISLAFFAMAVSVFAYFKRRKGN